MQNYEPVVVEVTRGPAVERRHRVVVCAVDRSGTTVLERGDPGLVTPARSTVKLLQALPLIRSGAAAEFGLSTAELALACSSHAGEDVHRAAVCGWLDRLGLGPEALRCGPAVPLRAEAADRFLSEGNRPTPLAHNCSGKHAGFLTLACHLGADPQSYLDPAGPTQRLVLEAVTQTCGLTPDPPLAIDGCSAPVACLAVRHLAGGIATVLAAGSAEQRLLDAMAAHPELVAGDGLFDTRLATATSGRILGKGGADGVHVAYLRDLGVGLAVKTLDGDARAAELALSWALTELTGTIDEPTHRPITNARGTVVGEARVRS